MKKLGWLLVKEPNSIGMYRERFTYVDGGKQYIRQNNKYIEIEVKYYDEPRGFIKE